MDMMNTTRPALLHFGEVLLRALRQDDYPLVFQLRTESSSLHLWKGSYRIPSQREYYQDIDTMHRSHVDTFLVVSKRDNEDVVAGIAYTYDTSMTDGYTFGAIALMPQYRNRKFGTITAVLFMQYIFALSPIRKIYADVVEYNSASLALIRKLGFMEEGRFKKHRFHNGMYWDSLRFAFYRESIDDMVGKHLLSN